MNVAVVKTNISEIVLAILVEPMAKLAFDSEPILECVTEAKMLGPIVLVAEIKVEQGTAIFSVVGFAIERVSNVGTAVPTFCRVRDARRSCHQRRKRDGLSDARCHIHPFFKAIPLRLESGTQHAPSAKLTDSQLGHLSPA
jgi:hypothetical protein